MKARECSNPDVGTLLQASNGASLTSYSPTFSSFALHYLMVYNEVTVLSETTYFALCVVKVLLGRVACGKRARGSVRGCTQEDVAGIAASMDDTLSCMVLYCESIYM
jgi:hypothetical protein